MIASIARAADLSKIREGVVAVISMIPVPFSEKKLLTEEEFKELLDKWDKVLPEVEQEEGDFGIDNTGTFHVLTPDGWHLLLEFKNWVVCTKCLTDEVFMLEWVGINTGKTDQTVEYDDQSVWCKHCKCMTTTIPLVQLRKQGGNNDNNSEVSKSDTLVLV